VRCTLGHPGSPIALASVTAAEAASPGWRGAGSSQSLLKVCYSSLISLFTSPPLFVPTTPEPGGHSPRQELVLSCVSSTHDSSSVEGFQKLCHTALLSHPSFPPTEPEVRPALQLSPPAWEARCGPGPLPERRKAIVFVSANGRRASQAAATAASIGFSRCMVLQGGLAAFMNEGKGERRGPRFLSRNAVALLLQGQARPMANGVNGHSEPGSTPVGNGPEKGVRSPVLVDLRRHDERALYGSIAGSVHIPGEEEAAAKGTRFAGQGACFERSSKMVVLKYSSQFQPWNPPASDC
jgi:rhodanese-related sulfurtransferase